MAERRQLRTSEGLEGRSECPATGHGHPDPRWTSAFPSQNQLSTTGHLRRHIVCRTRLAQRSSSVRRPPSLPFLDCLIVAAANRMRSRCELKRPPLARGREAGRSPFRFLPRKRQRDCRESHPCWSRPAADRDCPDSNRPDRRTESLPRAARLKRLLVESGPGLLR